MTMCLCQVEDQPQVAENGSTSTNGVLVCGDEGWDGKQDSSHDEDDGQDDGAIQTGTRGTRLIVVSSTVLILFCTLVL